MRTSIGPVIKVDGEKEYRDAMRNIIAQTKALDSEMKLLAASFANSTDKQGKAAAQADVLKKQLEQQKKAVEEVNKQYQKAVEKYGENSTEAAKYRKNLIEAQTAVKNTENAIEDLGDELKNNGKTFNNAGKEALSFGDILKSNVFGQLIVDGAKRIAEAARDIGSQMLQTAADEKALQSQFEQTFGGMQSEATAAIKAISKEANIVDTRLTGVASSIYAFAKASGGSEAQSMELMEKALQATADAAAYYDRSLEETSESLTSFLKGNYSNDAALGVSATEFTRNAAATKLFNKEFKDLNEIQKQQALLQMVIDAQKRSGAMGQAAREATGWTNVTANLSIVWQKFLAKVGTPVLERVIPVIVGITEKMAEMVENTDWEKFNQSVNSFVTFFTENGGTIVAAVTAIGAAFASWNIVSMITGVIEKIKEVDISIKGISALLSGNIFGIRVAGIAAVVAGLTTLYATNEDFKAFVDNATLNVKTFFRSLGASLVESKARFLEYCSKVKENFLRLIQKFRDGWNNTKKINQQALADIKDFGKKIGDTFIGLAKEALIWGSDMIKGFGKGIMSRASYLLDQVKSTANKIRSYLHFSRPDTGPLRDYETWMPDFMQGLAKGIKQNSYLVEDAVSSLSGKMVINPRYALQGAGGGGNRTLTIQKIEIHGYDDQTAERIVNEIDRRLGELLDD